jgi:hypothetical protein
LRFSSWVLPPLGAFYLLQVLRFLYIWRFCNKFKWRSLFKGSDQKISWARRSWTRTRNTSIDLTKLDKSECWRWSLPRLWMHQYILDWLSKRLKVLNTEHYLTHGTRSNLPALSTVKAPSYKPHRTAWQPFGGLGVLIRLSCCGTIRFVLIKTMSMSGLRRPSWWATSTSERRKWLYGLVEVHLRQTRRSRYGIEVERCYEERRYRSLQRLDEKHVKATRARYSSCFLAHRHLVFTGLTERLSSGTDIFNQLFSRSWFTVCGLYKRPHWSSLRKPL